MVIRRCTRCMHELKPTETVCPECGQIFGSVSTEPFALRPGTILEGKYLVGEMMGQGGFGITYVGFDLLLEQKVAIKEYYPMRTGMVSRENASTVVWSTAMAQKTGIEKGFDSFLKEARKMARLRNIPSVVGVNSVFIQNETAYIVMDFVEGETLLKKLEREGPMDFDTCVSLLTPIMQALAEVHRHGIIHRDISPDNIMVQKDGRLILLDLGAAKDLDIQDADGAVQSSQMVAKQGFSPMEQYTRNGQIGPWTDVYAMAATIYYCCTGVLPPTAIDRLDEDTLTCKPRLTKQQFDALAKCMGVRPKERPQDMDAMMALLLPAEKTEPEPKKPQKPKAEKPPQKAPVKPEPPGKTEPAKPESPMAKPTKKSRLPKVLIAIAAVVVCCVGALLFRGGYSNLSARKSLDTRTTGSAINTTNVKYAISAGDSFTFALKSDGTVMTTGTNRQGQRDTSGWTDIVAVSAGKCHGVGLKSNGTVVAAGLNDCGQCNISDWTDIIAVSTGSLHTVGLRADGTVVSVGSNSFGQCNTSEWSNIVSISAGADHTVGLKSDGTVVAVGSNSDKQCNVSDWSDIVDVSAGGFHTVGLKANGTVVAVGMSGNAMGSSQCNVSDWSDIVAVSAGKEHTVGLKSDGTVVAVGSNILGQCKVPSWTDIVAISAGTNHTIGLKSDGTMIATGSNEYGQCDVSDWIGVFASNRTDKETKQEDSKTASKLQYDAAEQLLANGETAKAAIAFGKLGDYSDARERSFELWENVAVRKTIGTNAEVDHVVGVKSNGTVVTAGSNSDGQCNVSDWTDIMAVTAGRNHTVGLKSNGTVVAAGSNSLEQCNVANWSDIVAIAAGPDHTIGLKSDGTVVATGSNSSGQCDVTNWSDIVAVSAGKYHTLGLKFNGTVVAAGWDNSGRCDVSDWTDIVAISAGGHHSVGLKSNGTVVAIGDNQWGQCDVSNWTDIVAISASFFSTVGVKSDGTVVGANRYDYTYATALSYSAWSDIVAVEAGDLDAIGLKANGTVVTMRKNSDISGWTNIRIPGQ